MIVGIKRHEEISFDVRHVQYYCGCSQSVMGAIFVCWPAWTDSGCNGVNNKKSVNNIWFSVETIQMKRCTYLPTQYKMDCVHSTFRVCSDWIGEWIRMIKCMWKTARKWISLIILKKLINGRVGNKGSLGLLRTVPLTTCCLLRLWQYNRRCSNKSCVACNSIIIADWLFSVEMLRLESKQPQSDSCWKHILLLQDIDLIFSWISSSALPFPSSLSCSSAEEKSLALKKNGLKLLYNKDNHQGQSSISEPEKHPPHQIIIFPPI